jgi:hypothetical protein
MGKSWYETGYDGAKEEAERRALGYPPDRLWQKPGSVREIVFVGDDPFCIREHQWRDSNDAWHYATCTAKIFDSGCGACGQTGVSRSDYVGHYTIIDLTGYTTEKGENKNRLILLPAKTKVLNKFKMKKENLGSLLGQIWNLTRADKDSPNTGDDLDHVREIKSMEGLLGVVTYKGKNLKEMLEKANGSGSDAEKTRKYLAHHFQIPESGPIPMKIPQFNYPVLMAPIETGELRGLVADAQPFNQNRGGGSSSSSSSSSADDVPF